METGYQLHFKTDTGKVRANNEDSFGEHKLPNGHLLVVCDGMGGHSGGELASKMGVECIIDYCKKSRSENAIIMIHEAIKFANTQVHGYASTYPEFKGMGTTCVVVFITTSGQIYYGHVGDSRLYAFTKQGLKILTKDHSYVQYLVDTGEIKESEMETHPSKNQILRALGYDETVKPDVCSEPYIPEQGDIFLLCSDGLNGMIGKEIITRILKELQTSRDLSLAADELIHSALEAGGRDNVTVGLLQVSKETSDQTIRISNQSDSSQNQLNMGAKILFFLTIILITVFTLNYFFGSNEENSNTPSKTESSITKADTLDLKKNENLPDKKSDTTKSSVKGKSKEKADAKTTRSDKNTKETIKPNNVAAQPEPVKPAPTTAPPINAPSSPPQSTGTPQNTLL
jgi:serine/threonine protein phosphatase PrpC